MGLTDDVGNLWKSGKRRLPRALGGGITPEQRLRRDPLPAFSFLVNLQIGKLDEEAQVFFKSVSGLRFETAVVPVVSGGNNRTTYKLVGATDWPNLVLRQGFTADSKLIAWRQAWLNGTARIRLSGDITLLDTALNPKAYWEFDRGWPCKWDISEFDASKSELSIETLEIAHNGLQYGDVSKSPKSAWAGTDPRWNPAQHGGLGTSADPKYEKNILTEPPKTVGVPSEKIDPATLE